MENPIRKMYEKILSKKLVALIEDKGPMFFANKELDKTYASGSSRYKFKEYPSELSYAPPVIDRKQEEVIEADRAAYLKKIEKLIKDGADVNYAGKSGADKTPLDAVCEANEALMAEAVVTRAPINGRPSFKPEFMGKSAAACGDVAKILLNNGAVRLASEKAFAKNFPDLADNLNKARAASAVKRAAVQAKGRG